MRQWLEYGRCVPTFIGAQALNEAFLRSTVLISYEPTPNTKSSGTGFFLFRPLTGDRGQVFLITNKHVLPPSGAEKAIHIRVIVGSGDKANVRLVEVPVVGKDGKYVTTVQLHPSPGFDVAAINVTETILKQNIQGSWLPLDLLSTPDRLKNEGITVGDEIFLPLARQSGLCQPSRGSDLEPRSPACGRTPRSLHCPFRVR